MREANADTAAFLVLGTSAATGPADNDGARGTIECRRRYPEERSHVGPNGKIQFWRKALGPASDYQTTPAELFSECGAMGGRWFRADGRGQLPPGIRP